MPDLFPGIVDVRQRHSTVFSHIILTVEYGSPVFFCRCHVALLVLCSTLCKIVIGHSEIT